MSKGYDSRAIANIFVNIARDSGDRLTIMSLLKYVYFAHGWTLGHTGEPLISHDVFAWEHGPVVPEVYKEFRPQGIQISETAIGYPASIVAKMDARTRNIVHGTYREYSSFTAFQLSEITHRKSAPWYKYRDNYQAKIPNSEIRDYYLGIIQAKAKNV